MGLIIFYFIRAKVNFLCWTLPQKCSILVFFKSFREVSEGNLPKISSRNCNITFVQTNQFWFMILCDNAFKLFLGQTLGPKESFYSWVWSYDALTAPPVTITNQCTFQNSFQKDSKGPSQRILQEISYEKLWFYHR